MARTLSVLTGRIPILMTRTLSVFARRIPLLMMRALSVLARRTPLLMTRALSVLARRIPLLMMRTLSVLTRRISLSAVDVVAHSGLWIADGTTNLHEPRPGTGQSRFRQPGAADFQDSCNFSWVQQLIESARLC